MGTNFYLKQPPKPACPTCGHQPDADDADDEGLHIGKSSHGWCFSLHVIPEEGINSLDDWKKRFEQGYIENEYGETLTPEEMLSEITERRSSHEWRDPKKTCSAWYSSWRDFHQKNHSTEGPRGLLRHDSNHCVGHGEGTWDLISGEFS